MKYLALLISALLLSGCGLFSKKEVNYDKLAQNLQFKKKYEEAATNWTLALAQGSSYDRHLSRGDCYRLYGKYDLAASDYTQAMALRPGDNDTARLARMKVLLKDNQISPALADADYFIQKNVHTEDALTIQAACLYQTGDYTNCVIKSEQLIKRGARTDHEFHYNLAMAYYKIYKEKREPADYKTKALKHYETFFTKKSNAGYVITSDDWFYRGALAWVNLDTDSRNKHWKNLPADYLKKKNINVNDL